MKTLKARKTKDAWLITITDTRTAYSEAEVLKEIRENGLEVAEHHRSNKEDKNEWIYAR